MGSARPNILWFCTDQQRFDTIGALGNRFVDTPVIDSLVAAGTAFTHAYCQSPICTPSRASFLSGRYPSTIRVNGNGNAAFPPDVPLVTRRFADAGYVCGNIGKLHLASAHKGVEPRVDDGYSYFKYSHAPRDQWASGHDYADWVKARGQSLKALTEQPDGVPAEFHQSTWCAECAIDFVGAHRDGPWLLTVNPFDPHPPFDPPASYRDRFDPAAMPGPHFAESDLAEQAALAPADFQTRARRPDRERADSAGEAAKATYNASGAVPLDADMRRHQAAYYAMIKLIDDSLGRILQALEATGQRQRTIIIFTSDHGEMLGDHGLLLKGARFYEGLVRVPLIWSLPGTIEAGRQSPALVELLDIAPTLLDLCGVEGADGMQGRSLAPILTGRADPDRHRDFVRCEYLDALDAPEGTLATMLRDRRHKLVVYHQHPFGELYDLEADPWEFRNLWDSPEHQGVKLDLMKKSFDAAILAMDKGPPRVAPW